MERQNTPCANCGRYSGYYLKDINTAENRRYYNRYGDLIDTKAYRFNGPVDISKKYCANCDALLPLEYPIKKTIQLNGVEVDLTIDELWPNAIVMDFRTSEDAFTYFNKLS
jgi:hypothetical protein